MRIAVTGATGFIGKAAADVERTEDGPALKSYRTPTEHNEGTRELVR